MTTALAIPSTIPEDNGDLKGKTIPQVCREAVGFSGMNLAARVEASRRYLYITQDERWKDPLKYGRDHDDPLFGFSKLGEMSSAELGDFFGGISERLARAHLEAAMIVGYDDLARFTSRAIERLAPYPEALKRACRDIKNGNLVTDSRARELVQPWIHRTKGKSRVSVDEDERRSFSKRIADLERENRSLRQENSKMKGEQKPLREELRLARQEIGELQKKLFAK